MTATPTTKSALALALIAGAMAGTDSFPLPPHTASSEGDVLYWPAWDLPPTHCPRCTAPMVRVRHGPSGRLWWVECLPCAPGWGPDDACPDGRDWRRLRRWRAVRGLVTP